MILYFHDDETWSFHLVQICCQELQNTPNQSIAAQKVYFYQYPSVYPVITSFLVDIILPHIACNLPVLPFIDTHLPGKIHCWVFVSIAIPIETVSVHDYLVVTFCLYIYIISLPWQIQWIFASDVDKWRFVKKQGILPGTWSNIWPRCWCHSDDTSVPLYFTFSFFHNITKQVTIGRRQRASLNLLVSWTCLFQISISLYFLLQLVRFTRFYIQRGI